MSGADNAVENNALSPLDYLVIADDAYSIGAAVVDGDYKEAAVETAWLIVDGIFFFAPANPFAFRKATKLKKYGEKGLQFFKKEKQVDSAAKPAVKKILKPSSAVKPSVKKPDNIVNISSAKQSNKPVTKSVTELIQTAPKTDLTSRSVREANIIKIRQKPGTNKSAFDGKVKELQKLAKDKKLVKTKPSKRDRRLIDEYRKDLNNRIDQQYGKQNLEFAAKLKQYARDKIDIDHMHELQLGGKDIFKNMRALDRPTNRSIGAQISQRIKHLPEGTQIDRIVGH